MSAPERLATDSIPWRVFPEATGVEYKVLRKHAEHGGSTLLLRFAPGADYPTHRHPRGEEYYVLAGTLADGSHTYRTGDYIYYAPGSVHRPSSPDGCTVLVVLPARVEMLDAPGDAG
ncbi:MAG TPA: dimethylsulfonioproprionate lyase family protein [Candidatus Udaeobacter sp.]|nr:dimethylsulfonioproprionate lyase family protein [Candidatus Udaeobacter sp.]